LRISSFYFEIKLPANYRNRLKKSHKMLEKGESDFGFESLKINKFLYDLIGDNDILLNYSKVPIFWGDTDYKRDSSHPILLTTLYNQIFDSSLFSSIGFNTNDLKIEFFRVLQALSSGGSKSNFIDLNKTRMNLVKNSNELLDLSDLSDGEFQILINASIVDLFDSEESIFLLDEIDAHLHPGVVSKVWKTFSDLQGYALSSSHNVVSISNSDYRKIFFLKNGDLVSEVKSKISLLDEVCGKFHSR